MSFKFEKKHDNYNALASHLAFSAFPSCAIVYCSSSSYLLEIFPPLLFEMPINVRSV